MPICKPQALGWQTGPPREFSFCNMKHLVRNTPGKEFPKAKGDDAMINFTHKTQELSLSPEVVKFGQDLPDKKWANNLKGQFEYSTSEYELPNIIYNQLNNTEETLQILVDGNEKINGNLFKAEPQRKRIGFSEHHELSDEEIINEAEKDMKIIEKKVQKTHTIKQPRRTL
ncbi:hypothetical protein O181_034655 [Austropuccinia psidii MF-1]|uniref:Uncharacterized protein n=1 Tax=Austropuccinia psidii MF-1 TaxID=1389203 RepID=A0A9Q3D3E1_9BASI|nr:hypothetical protein [Austropuccinia psidii MF-1]